jgi:hypothetical protein
LQFCTLFSIEIKAGDSTNSHKWHLNKHEEIEEVAQFLDCGTFSTKRESSTPITETPKRQKIQSSASKFDVGSNVQK